MEVTLQMHKDDIAWLVFIGETDRIFELRPDGSAHEVDYDDDNRETYREIDLVAELRDLAEEE